MTAAHCVNDMVQDSRKGILIKPKVLSRYYGDIFEAEILAVDDHADIAILQVAWNSHPTLELATTEEVLQAKEIIIAGYPPSFDERFRKKSYRDVFIEVNHELRVKPRLQRSKVKHVEKPKLNAHESTGHREVS